MSSREQSIVIRDAGAGDLAAIVEFNRRLAIETEAKVLDSTVLVRGVTRALAEPERLRYWVAELALEGRARTIGQTAISREWSDWRNGWIWWLQSVYIDEGFRGRGVFRALYKHIQDAALAEPDVIGLRLYVEDGNLRAQRTYQALGMKPGGYSVLEELWLERSGPA